jgi:hypothetical protein
VSSPRRSSRKKEKSQRRKDADAAALASMTYTVPTPKTQGDAVPRVHFVYAAVEPDPKNYKAARRSPNSEKWAEAERIEFASLEANGTWQVVRLPPGAICVHSKWVYKTKLNSDGTVERYKARLVACGSEQVYGVNFLLTFSAVLELASSKAIFVFAWIWGVPARHGDVPSAYVKAQQEDGLDIYLYVPDGMTIGVGQLKDLGASSSREVGLLLCKSLYGLKQAGRRWHKLLDRTLKNLGYEQCITDTCLYYLADRNGITVVGVYVDDVLVTGTSTARVDDFFAAMCVLELKDLGAVSKFLGMRVAFDPTQGYVIDQEQAIDELLLKNGLDDANPVRIPVCDDETPSGGVSFLLPETESANGEMPSIRQFQSLIGSLLWIARCTRPDIAFAVHRASCRSHAPTVTDYAAAKRVARYLKGTKELKLHMRPNGKASSTIKIECFTDADFAADKSDRKSISAGAVFANGMLVSWHCKKQTAVALSTAEAEFVSGSVGAREALGLRELVQEFGFRVELPMPLWIDNQAGIKQIENESSSSESKHVDVKLKFIRDFAAKRVLKPQYLATSDMIADLLTKALPAPRLVDLRTRIGIC